VQCRAQYAHTYCTRTVLALSAYCTRTMYSHTVLTLSAYCTHTMYSHTAHYVLTHCTHTVLVLYSHCRCIGLIVGTLSVGSYLEVLNKLRRMLER
jgi:hypothetical protein